MRNISHCWLWCASSFSATRKLQHPRSEWFSEAIRHQRSFKRSSWYRPEWASTLHIIALNGLNCWRNCVVSTSTWPPWFDLRRCASDDFTMPVEFRRKLFCWQKYIVARWIDQIWNSLIRSSAVRIVWFVSFLCFSEHRQLSFTVENCLISILSAMIDCEFFLFSSLIAGLERVIHKISLISGSRTMELSPSASEVK